ncbi:uncharacterized protein LOC130729097 [Lotus japonicus]|uniref:uncharacterized protein LOC130729097 n=1 Tax=Lotus japonicus TaxID=34305 RepID=UPI002590D32A|nr:uncharacterized protein LOC130729097 [Lotus japonicus]
MAAEETSAKMEARLRDEITAQVAAENERDRQLREEQEAQRDVAEEWLRTQVLRSITSWVDLAEIFTAKFFPYNRIRKLKQEINSFIQLDSENLYETWERFKRLLMKCSGHNISTADQVEKFYAALNDYTKTSLTQLQNWKGVYEVETLDAVLASNKKLAQKVDAMVKRLEGGQRSAKDVEFDEEVKAMRNYQNDPYSSTYNPDWRNHPNFSWRDQNNSGDAGGSKQFPNQRQYQLNQRPPPPHGKKSLEEIVADLALSNQSFMNETRSFMNETITNSKNYESSIKHLETQVGQIAKDSKFENCSAVTRRSDKTLNEIEELVEKKSDETEKVVEKEKEGTKSEEAIKNKKSKDSSLEKITCKLPFPKALEKKNMEKQFSKFLEIFKTFQINIPFSEALEQMPTYAKFMKDIVSGRKRLSEVNEKIMMTEECSAIVQRKLLQKLKGPVSFTIHVDIKGLPRAKALCDLGASINLIPLSMFKSLDMGEATPTLMSLLLADRSIKRPYGVAGDVLVRVEKIIFPVDFVILDIEEDSRVPLILGRPFLATSNAKIKVAKSLLSLKVGDENVKFSVFRTLKHPNYEDVFNCEVIDESVCEEFARISGKAPLEEKKDNCELSLTLIKLVGKHQYGGSATENLHNHMARFIHFSNTVRIKDEFIDAFMLRLFPHSLKYEAKVWFQSQPQGSIVTWEDLVGKFSAKFLPCSFKSLSKCDSNPS